MNNPIFIYNDFRHSNKLFKKVIDTWIIIYKYNILIILIFFELFFCFFDSKIFKEL
jgi:hypothetical protein